MQISNPEQTIYDECPIPMEGLHPFVAESQYLMEPLQPEEVPTMDLSLQQHLPEYRTLPPKVKEQMRPAVVEPANPIPPIVTALVEKPERNGLISFYRPSQAIYLIRSKADRNLVPLSHVLGVEADGYTWEMQNYFKCWIAVGGGQSQYLGQKGYHNRDLDIQALHTEDLSDEDHLQRLQSFLAESGFVPYTGKIAVPLYLLSPVSQLYMRPFQNDEFKKSAKERCGAPSLFVTVKNEGRNIKLTSRATPMQEEVYPVRNAKFISGAHSIGSKRPDKRVLIEFGLPMRTVEESGATFRVPFFGCDPIRNRALIRAPGSRDWFRLEVVDTPRLEEIFESAPKMSALMMLRVLTKDPLTPEVLESISTYRPLMLARYVGMNDEKYYKKLLEILDEFLEKDDPQLLSNMREDNFYEFMHKTFPFFTEVLHDVITGYLMKGSANYRKHKHLLDDQHVKVFEYLYSYWYERFQYSGSSFRKYTMYDAIIDLLKFYAEFVEDEKGGESEINELAAKHFLELFNFEINLNAR